jgi:hypothetical protein
VCLPICTHPAAELQKIAAGYAAGRQLFVNGYLIMINAGGSIGDGFHKRELPQGGGNVGGFGVVVSALM